MLLAAQVAASVVLLVGAGLFARSFRSFGDVDAGFDTENVLSAYLWSTMFGYDAEAEIDTLQRLLERATALPGVRDGAIGGGPIMTMLGTPPALRGRPNLPVWPASRGPVEQDAAEQIPFTVASLGYHRTLDIPLVRGRDFSVQDEATSADVVVVNEAMARHLWPDRDPLGEELTLLPRPPWLTEPRRVRVIGVSGDTAAVSASRFQGRFLEADPGILHDQPKVILPLWMSTPPSTWASLFIRTSVPPTSLVPALHDELAKIDPNLVLFPESMAARWAKLTAYERTYSMFMGLFGLLAAGLCAVGIYGAMAHTVSRRRHEIGVRMALGARHSDVVGAVVRQGVVPTVFGLAVGMAAALALSRIVGSLLYGVSPTDPLTYAAVGALVIGVAAAASWVPARRAARVDPVESLRAE
jgi:predicted permease